MIRLEKGFHIMFFLCLLSTSVFSNPFICLDSSGLAKTKKEILNGTAAEQTITAYQKLIKDADKLLKVKNPTIMDKTILPPTGDKHDYLSISRYWWPDPEKEDGLPWIRHDGKTNPDTQTDAVDRKRLGLMSKGVWKLSLAYYFTEDEKYAYKATDMIATWFINPATRMNPHLNYAQSVPGNPKLRRSGILDGRSIVRFVPDAINLLSSSVHWNDNYQTKTTEWFSNYLNWLTQSPLGKKGSLQKNNHGSWYKFQVAALAFYLGERELVKDMVILAQQSLSEMLNENGGQTHELKRSRSFFYSCFNLQALSNIATLADKVGMNMWQYQSADNKSLELAIGYLTPVVNGEIWNHKTLKPIDYTDLIPIISAASKNGNEKEKYKKLLSKILEKSEGTKQKAKVLDFWLLDRNY